MIDSRKIAVLLLSGGIDSATTAAFALSNGFNISALTFSYGQRHGIEIESAKKLCRHFAINKQIIIDIPMEIFSSSALLADSSGIPKNRDISSILSHAGTITNDSELNNINVINDKKIPSTYVPGRNILFLSYALSYAESVGSRDIFIGVNALDYSGYPDCRPEFIASFEAMANTGTKAGVLGDSFKIHAPLLKLKKSEIIKLGKELGVDFSLTHSCYDPDENGSSCGECDSCQIRINGFLEAGINDPTVYKKK